MNKTIHFLYLFISQDHILAAWGGKWWIFCSCTLNRHPSFALWPRSHCVRHSSCALVDDLFVLYQTIYIASGNNIFLPASSASLPCKPGVSVHFFLISITMTCPWLLCSCCWGISLALLSSYNLTIPQDASRIISIILWCLFLVTLEHGCCICSKSCSITTLGEKLLEVINCWNIVHHISGPEQA